MKKGTKCSRFFLVISNTPDIMYMCSVSTYFNSKTLSSSSQLLCLSRISHTHIFSGIFLRPLTIDVKSIFEVIPVIYSLKTILIFQVANSPKKDNLLTVSDKIFPKMIWFESKKWKLGFMKSKSCCISFSPNDNVCSPQKES